MGARKVDEAILKSELAAFFREHMRTYLCFRLEDKFTHGIPDFSITGGRQRRTVWLEVKYATPNFAMKGIQELTLSRLSIHGFAAFVIYYDYEGVRRTYIVDPNDIGKKPEEWTSFVEGFNHAFVATYVKRLTT